MEEATSDFALGSYSALNKTFTKLHVERGGTKAALGNNKSLLLYDLEQTDEDQHKRAPVYRYKDETKRLFAIRFNPHHNRRMQLASAKGHLVHVWNLEEKVPTATSTRGVMTLHQQSTTANVMDICWSRFDENLLAAGDCLWDMRQKSPVQAWKVPGGDSRVLTTQVSFNRKSPYLLASSQVNQVYIWDLRKGQKPIDTISASLPTDHVTSLDWSSKSEYELLTSGGENFSLWRVDRAKAKHVSSRGTPGNSAKIKGAFGLVKRRKWSQPVKKVLFAPFGQAAITVSRGFFEGRQELQTIKMWSLPSQDLELAATFNAGIHPIVGVSWRLTGDGYQVASLDTADHLRLHNVERLDFENPDVEAPIGESSGGRDYGSTAGSESLEPAATSKAHVLRDELFPVVWSLSELQRPARSKMAVEATPTNPIRELMQVESIANRGGFGSVPSMDLHAARKRLTLVMAANATARPPSTHVAQLGGRRNPRERGPDHTLHPPGPDAVQYVAMSRLRVLVSLQPGHRSHALIELAAEDSATHSALLDPATIACKDPLDEATVKQMQTTAEDVMHQLPKPGKSRVEACLIRLRRDLDECVRNAANQAAGLAARDELLSQPVGTQHDTDDTALASPGASLSAANDEAIPCPRRFGATFAANGTLVVFSSSMEAVRAGRKCVGDNGQQVYTYPRTYGCLKECMTAGPARHRDNDEKSHSGCNVSQSLVTDNGHSWFRPAWEDGFGDTCENADDDTYDLDRVSTEEVFVEEDREALESSVMADSTRLPISHPDHSLGAGLGLPSENEGEDRDAEEDPAGPADVDNERELPWTPKFNQICLVDCTSFLPGSPFLAAFYKLGPVRQSAARDGSTSSHRISRAEKNPRHGKSEQYFGLVLPDMKDHSGGGSDTSVSSGGRSRRNSLVSSLGFTSGVPPLLSIPQRGLSATPANMTIGAGFGRRPSVDGAQIVPPVLTKRWKSSSDFRGVVGKGGGWSGPSGSGRSMIGGSPSLVGSPGRSELARGIRYSSRSGSVDDIKISSPQLQAQTSELEDVAELPLDGTGVNVTPPRSMGVPGGDLGTLSAQSYLRTRQRLSKRRHHQQFPRSPGSSVDVDTSHLRLGVLTPTSPAGTAGPVSSSPPMSDFGVDLGQVPAATPTSQAAANAIGQEAGSRSSSFSGGASLAYGDLVGDGQLAVQLGLGGRGAHIPTPLPPTAVHAPGVGIRSGGDFNSDPSFFSSCDEESPGTPTVAHLSRNNVRVAAAMNRKELASAWALLADAADRGAPGKMSNSGMGEVHDARRLPRWKSSSARLVSKILAHYETFADPQMLASIASVVSSGSRDGGCSDGLSQREGQTSSYGRFMDCYAERCYHWGAERERAKTICHQTKSDHRLGSWHDTERPTDEGGGLVCAVCDETVRGRPLLCHRCGHGGHSKHVTGWFELERECRHEACECLCWENLEVE
ncbi:unnamed protein product [Scytosiphon promiscuus]